MSVFQIVVLFALAVICSAMAYNGLFGQFFWRWTRIPFAFVGSILMGIGMNGVPMMPMRDDEESKVEQEVHAKATDEREDEDNRDAPFNWALSGLSPADIKRQVVSIAKTPQADRDFDDIEWNEERESNASFVARRSGGRSVLSGVA